MDQATLFSNNERAVERSQRLHELGFTCGQANVINVEMIRNTLKKIRTICRSQRKKSSSPAFAMDIKQEYDRIATFPNWHNEAIAF